MMRKKLINVLLFLFFIFAGNIKGQESIQHKINNIDIFALNLNLCEDVLYCPPINRNCIDFFDNLANIECYKINDNTKIAQLLYCLKNLKPTKAKRINVKYKILFYSNDSLVYSACIGDSTTLLDGFCYKNSEELINILFDIRKTPQIVNFKIPNSNKNVIIKGKSNLTKKLRKISKEIDEDVNIYIRGICKADKSGKIFFVKLVQNPFVNSNMNRKVREIERVLRKKIKLNENKERMSSDVIPIKIKITKNIVYSNMHFI